MDRLTCKRCNGIKDGKGWIPVEEQLPEDDEMVLMQVSGKPMENITLDNAFELGTKTSHI